MAARGDLAAAIDAYVGQVWANSSLGFNYVYPFAADWDAGSRLTLCYLCDRDGRQLAASKAGSGE